MNEQAIFTAALERESGLRLAFIEQACGNDVELRQRVEKLLRLHAGAGGFLEQPAAAEVGLTLAHPQLERPGMQIGPYKLLQQVGEGGFGAVYMAEQQDPVRRMVALKIIKAGMDTRGVIARFEAERQALALMDHPNIAKVFEAGTTESGRPYFVMELVKGVPITKYCDDKRLSLKERLELLIPVCQAIQHAHQKGIIHRDIKPNNVLVAQYDGKPVPKVIDFGVAKATAQKLTERTMFTELGQIVGTLEYMSPEQAELNQLDIDTRSDIYSLGVLLYELLTGSTPFDKHKLRTAAFHEMLRIIREDEPPKPSTNLSTSGTLPSIAANRQSEPARLSKAVRGELDWIVMKALEKDRNRRYESANGLAADVQRYLNDEAVQACPPSARYRFGKFARKNRATLTTAAAVAMVLLIGTAVSTWQAIRATNAEAQAKANEVKAVKEERKARDEQKKALAAAAAEGAAKVAEANQRLRAEAGERQAEKNFESALEAVDRLLAHVGTNELNDVPRIQPVRRKILHDALEYYERLLAKSGNSAAIRFRMAKTWTGMARLCTSLGDYDAAERAYEPALAMLEQLVTEEPSRDDYRKELANCLIAAGYFYQWAVPEREKMERSFREAIELYEKLAKDHPQDGGLVIGKSMAENELIRSRVVFGGRDEAIAHTRRTIALLEESKGATRRQFGQAWRQLGELLAPIDSIEADKALRRAIIDYRAWVNKSSEDRVQLAKLLNFAGTHLKPRFADEANEYFREGETLLTALIDDHPTNPHFRIELAWNLRSQARLLGQTQGEAAKEDSTITIALFTETDAKYDAAIETVRQLVADFPGQHKYRAELVRFLSEYSTQLRPLAAAESARAHSEAAAAQILKAESLFQEAVTTQRQTVSAFAVSQDQYDLARMLLEKSEYLLGQVAGAAQPEDAAALQPHAAALREEVSGIVSNLDPRTSDEYLARGTLHETLGDAKAAIADYEISLGIASGNAPQIANALSRAVWRLATSPNDDSLDPQRAVALSKKILLLAPERGGFALNLGVAHYRAGNWQEALEALEKAMPHRNGGDCADWFFLAMVHWQLGDRTQARQWFDKADQLMTTRHHPDWPHFRAEAAGLLGIMKEPKPENETSPKPDEG